MCRSNAAQPHTERDPRSNVVDFAVRCQIGPVLERSRLSREPASCGTPRPIHCDDKRAANSDYSKPGFCPRLCKNFYFTKFLLTCQLFGDSQIVLDGVLDVAERLFLCLSLRPATWKTWARNAIALFCSAESDGILHGTSIFAFSRLGAGNSRQRGSSGSTSGWRNSGIVVNRAQKQSKRLTASS